MKKEKKLTKKASAKVFGLVSKIDPKVSKNITFDEAWEKIATHYDLTGSVETNVKGITKFTLYRGSEDDNVLDVYYLPNVFKDGEWDWTTIYKTVMEDMISRRLYKQLKSSKKVSKASPEKPIKKETKAAPVPPTKSIDELRSDKHKIHMKIYQWSKKGKDVSELKKQEEELDKMIKNMKRK